MNTDQLYTDLRQLGFRNPNYELPQGQPTYVVIELAENADSVHFAASIVDPMMPEKGGPNDYLDLNSMQRIALELQDISHIMLDSLAGVAMHGPTDETICEKCEYDPDVIVKCLRWLSRKAAIQALQLATDTKGHA